MKGMRIAEEGFKMGENRNEEMYLCHYNDLDKREVELKLLT